ncbi:50S ribosomal protein L10 [Leptospira wolffii]|uniref:Large ribosomal subunit protein uL10 n=1 Tax=Leptospira wolffii TaxID=409998 RepID=A0A2M9ZGD4_9LEPT|nr:50S ribosomal protein L10 [Leptospira wolffii]EPG64465.1 ribosomal protein L10 [Leptospira wolffii serovar Khorat str. Khorat-H2]PJZ67434.1 50S ribosomal protein L10 [Leptospira wolffii]TGK62437.1 50S ribosomal protein L10 [Leptospira wolffii]TGK65980.1 50S ribosomal protein L10 [Leptospira wolffii]TGK74179.1 50S ribosomal protein L10 [Leptospira wolffii]
MPSQEKFEAVALLKGKLEKRSDFILASYSGLTVEEITGLRAKLRKEGSEMKVIKNNLFLLALKESEKHKDKNIAFGPEYQGPLAAIFSEDNLPTVAKVLKEFAKTNKNLILKAGYLDGSILDAEGVDAIAGLPSREQLLAQIAGGINGPARSIASGLNQIIAGLARAIQAVAEKNNQ